MSRLTTVAIAVAAICGLSAACAERETAFTVTVTADTVAFATQGAPTAPWIRFELPVIVRNTGTVPLFDAFCAVRLERRVGQTWTVVWSPVCAAGGTALSGLQPGGERRSTFVVTGPIGRAGSLWLPPVAGGSYRYVLGLTSRAPDVSGPGGATQLQPSNAFVLQEGPR